MDLLSLFNVFVPYTDFVLKSVFSKYVPLTFFLFLFSWNAFFYTFTFSLCLFRCEMSLIYAAAYMYGWSTVFTVMFAFADEIFFSFANFVFLVVAFSFPLRKDPLIFLIIPVQCWTLLALAFLRNSVSISNVNDSLVEKNILGFRSVFPFQNFVHIVPLSSRLQNFCCKVI